MTGRPAGRDVVGLERRRSAGIDARRLARHRPPAPLAAPALATALAALAALVPTPVRAEGRGAPPPPSPTLAVAAGDTPMPGLEATLAPPPPPADAAVQVAIVDERGAPVYCTANLTDGRARPDGDGGYRVGGLRPGRWTVRLDLPHERVDVLVTVEPGETVVVPPVVARGRCRAIALVRRAALRPLAELAPPAWSVRYDRTYGPYRGPLAHGLRWRRR